MQVSESTLKELIEGEKQFQVPLYQRQYSWRDPELAQLWDDILEQYDLLTPDDQGKIDPDAPTHFIGSTVLAPSPKIAAAGVTAFTVIDGQQTTYESSHRHVRAARCGSRGRSVGD